MARCRLVINDILVLVLCIFSVVGCQPSIAPVKSITQQVKLNRMLENLPVVKSVESWGMPTFISGSHGVAFKISTGHYDIYTSISDPLILRQVPTFLEFAFAEYVKLLEKPTVISKRMPVYIFNTRGQWEDFTKRWVGAQADVLKIQAGAYYLNGACVAYHISRKSNFSVLAHEAWHQFSDNVFQYNMPAWLDEGLATSFEAYRWKKGRVIFDSRLNGKRLYSLKKSFESGTLFTLAELLRLDAGRVLSGSIVDKGHGSISAPRVAAYYAQIYALTRFLREYNYRVYVMGFRRMVSDGCRGRWEMSRGDRKEALQSDRNPTRQWNARVGPEIFKNYIQAEHDVLEREYRVFCLKSIANARLSKE